MQSGTKVDAFTDMDMKHEFAKALRHELNAGLDFGYHVSNRTPLKNPVVMSPESAL